MQELPKKSGAGRPEHQPRKGRPRDRRIDAAIMGAAIEGLSELGYDRLSMEEIASRARVGKGALYRRWRSKAELVVAACTAWREEIISHAQLPDTGSLRGDLEALAEGFPPKESIEPHLAIMVGLIGPAVRDPELRAAISTTTLELPRQVFQILFDRAIQRGEIPAGREPGLACDAILAFNTFRWLLLGEVPDRDWVRRVMFDLVYPAVTASLET